MMDYNAFYIILEKKIYNTFDDFIGRPLTFEKYCEYTTKNKLVIQKLGNLHYLVSQNHKIHDNFTHKKSQKYEKMNDIQSNMFVSESDKNKYISIISTSIKQYIAFNRLAFIWKFKKAKLGCTDDMYMNPIDLTKNKHIEIIQEDSKYLFTVSDIIKIIHKSLNNSDELYTDPLPCKNPYNNIPFSKSNLYTIYYSIKKSDYNIPDTFHHYFLSNFSISKFIENYECILREKAIDNKSINECNDCLKEDIIDMIENFNDCHPESSININDDFPEDVLINSFLPYIKYYYRSIYSLSSSVKNKNNIYWRAGLKHFWTQNPQFGRKHIKRKTNNDNKKKISITFNQNLPLYKSPCDYNNDYNDSHMKCNNVERDFIKSYRKDIERRGRERRQSSNVVSVGSPDDTTNNFQEMLAQYENDFNNITFQPIITNTSTITIAIPNDGENNAADIFDFNGEITGIIDSDDETTNSSNESFVDELQMISDAVNISNESNGLNFTSNTSIVENNDSSN